MEGTEVDQHVGGEEEVRDERGNQVQFSDQNKAAKASKLNELFKPLFFYINTPHDLIIGVIF